MKTFLVLVLVTMISVWINADNSGNEAQDSFVLKVFKKRPFTIRKMRRILHNAKLKAHGYQVEKNTKVKRTSDGRREDTVSRFYYKRVPCSQAGKIEKELDVLLKGVFGKNVKRKLDQDLKKVKITSGSMCKVGFEVRRRRGFSNRMIKRGWKIRIRIRIRISIKIKKGRR
ncbi:uncharacterized protein LOC110236223 [Exaiptasia diaphana]|uniref:Uncharacterized protein n=1 Tax=Exaiptasia diaphana TaxID=2652724 RepID=A0A913X1E6_EXADI|nr:uncharacterized protein LOC110236223 [Exaiptasia diaphana]